MSETRVWIAQCLCPQRHCICAIAGDAVDVSDAQTALLETLREQVGELLAKRLFNPWCGLCHAAAHGWHYEVRRTRFATLDEAGPALRQLEAEQIVVASLWGDMPRSD
jgi:hypothetical protein